MAIKLYDYQLEAVNALQNGNILCGGVGSGKSRTALAYYFICNGGSIEPYKKMNKRPQDLYIITTARKRDTQEWEKDLAPFCMSINKKASDYIHEIHVDSWNNIQKYVEITDAFFIFDEQRVVGYGQWTRSFLKITKSNKWILLSATPGDTWMDYMPVFIANGFYKHKTDFISQHVIYSRSSRYPKIDRYYDTGRLNYYRRKILVNMDYRNHTIAHHDDITVEYDRILYKDLQRYKVNPETHEPIKNSSELCYYLRMMSNIHESRQQAVVDIVKRKKKVIIFYNFDYELEILKSLKYDIDIDISEWNGHKHQAIPMSDAWIYLVQYSAGAEGWNCVETDTLIFFSQSYSYKMTVQAAGRIDRLNTPFTDLYFYHLRSASPIDTAIRKCLKNKKDFNAMDYITAFS